MKKTSKLIVLAIGACSFMMGCSDSNPTNVAQPADTPTSPNFNAFSCQEVTDATVAAQLESAKASIKDVLEELGDNNLKNAQTISAQTKSTFGQIPSKLRSTTRLRLEHHYRLDEQHQDQVLYRHCHEQDKPRRHGH